MTGTRLCMSLTCICCGLRLLPAAFSRIYSVSKNALSSPPPPLSVSFSLSLFHRWLRRFVAPWDCRLRAERRPAAETLDLMKLRPCPDLREVSQSSVAKSTDGLWDCFVLGPEPKMAQTLKSHWLVGCSGTRWRRQAEDMLTVLYPALPRTKWRRRFIVIANINPLFHHAALPSTHFSDDCLIFIPWSQQLRS